MSGVDDDYPNNQIENAISAHDENVDYDMGVVIVERDGAEEHQDEDEGDFVENDIFNIEYDDDHNGNAENEDVEENEQADAKDDEFDDDDDEVKSPFERLIIICMRLARNDPTLTELDDWSNYGFSSSSAKSGLHWADRELMLLGHSLRGNTHLKSLHLEQHQEVDPSCYGHSVHGSAVLAAGIAQSQLQQLSITRLCRSFQQILLTKGLRHLASFQTLLINDTNVDLHALTIFVAFSTNPTNSINDHHASRRALQDGDDDNEATSSSTTETDTVARAHPSTVDSPPWMNQPPYACGLTVLKLSHCGITDDHLQLISVGVFHSCTLQTLAVERSQFSDAGILRFCRNWPLDSALQVLDFRANDIGRSGACALIEATRQHPAMRRLVLTCNTQIGYEGLRILGQDLLPTLTLLELELHNVVSEREKNDPNSVTIRDAACRAMANGLQQNTMLQELSIGYNSLGPVGAQTILRAVATHPTLRRLCIFADRSIGLDGMTRIAAELPTLQNLKELELNSICKRWPPKRKTNVFAEANKAGRALLEGVQQNHQLQRLELKELHEMWMTPIEFYLDLNQTCRPLVLRSALRHRDDVVASSVWPIILAKLSRDGKTSHIFYSLQEQPWLVPRPDQNVGML